MNDGSDFDDEAQSHQFDKGDWFEVHQAKNTGGGGELHVQDLQLVLYPACNGDIDDDTPSAVSIRNMLWNQTSL